MELSQLEDHEFLRVVHDEIERRTDDMILYTSDSSHREKELLVLRIIMDEFGHY